MYFLYKSALFRKTGIEFFSSVRSFLIRTSILFRISSTVVIGTLRNAISSSDSSSLLILIFLFFLEPFYVTISKGQPGA